MADVVKVEDDDLRMSVEIVSSTKREHSAGEQLDFRVSNVDASFANALRRIMLAEIPTLAVEKVDVRTNTSVFHDEMLVHRLALVPLLSTKAAHLKYTRECTCAGQGCDACQVTLSLSVRCPIDMHSVKVTSNDLVPSDAEIRPVAAGTDGIWLLTLGRAQEVDMTCYVRKGIAKLHAKYNPCATVAMSYASDIRLNHQGLSALDEERRKTWVSRCPTGVFGFNAQTHQVSIENMQACIYCKECQTIDFPFNNLPAALVQVKERKNRLGQYFVNFSVESTGVLPALDIVYHAIAVLRMKLQAMRAAVTEAKASPHGMSSCSSTVQQGAAFAVRPVMRPIGIAPTTVTVVNEDAMPRNEADEDNFAFAMS